MFQELIIHGYFYYLLGIFVFAVFLIILNLNDIRKLLSFRKKTIIILLLIILFSIFVRVYITPHTFQIFDDEYIYVDIAENFQESQNYCGSGVGMSECKRSPYPSGHPFMLFLFTALFGFSTKVLLLYPVIIGVLSVPLIFILSYCFSKNEKIALLSSFILSILPIHIILSGSPNSDISSFFFSLIVLSLTLISLKIKTRIFFITLLLSLLFLIQIRVENILFLFLIGFYFLLKRELQFLKNNFTVILLFFLLLMPLLANLSTVNFVMEKQPSDLMYPKVSLSLTDNMSYLQETIQANLLFWISNLLHPIIITLFVFVSIKYLFRKNKTHLYFLTSYFLLFLLSYSAYTENLKFSIGVSFRHTLLLYIPIVLLASFGLYYFVANISNSSLKKIIFLFLFLYLLLIPFISYNSINKIHSPARSEFEFLRYINQDVFNCSFFTNRVPPIKYFFEDADYLRSLFQRSQFNNCSMLYLNYQILGAKENKAFIERSYDLKTLYKGNFSGQVYELSIINKE